MKSAIEARAEMIIKGLGLHKEFYREMRFHAERKWRFDFASPRYYIAIEIEGAVWTGGRHTRGGGFEKDCEKYNEATLIGWRILRYTSKTVNKIAQDLPELIKHVKENHVCEWEDPEKCCEAMTEKEFTRCTGQGDGCPYAYSDCEIYYHVERCYICGKERKMSHQDYLKWKREMESK